MLKLSLNEMLQTSNDGTKLPKEEVAKAIEAMVQFVNRAMEEPKIQTVLDEVRKLAIDTNAREISIEEKVTCIKQQASSTAGSSTRSSYASVLGQPSTASFSEGGVPIQPPIPKRNQAPYNKDNEIVIKLQDEIANKVLEGKRPQEMTDLVNEYIKNTDDKRKPIRTARRLFSGDISVMAANEEEANALREHKEWMTRLSSNARAVTKTYGLLLHGVRIDSINLRDMAQAIQQVKTDNAYTLSLDIIWIGWFKKHKEGQDKCSLIIELASPEDGNKALEEGLVIGSEIHGCYVYNKQCRSKQCFICWKYGHLSTICPTKETPVCGKCLGEHHHNECTTEAKRCPICGGNHEAWNKVCVHRKKEIVRMRQERLYTPQRFDIPRGRPTTNQVNGASARAYFNNATRGELAPKISSQRGGLGGRGGGSSRGGRPSVPDLNKIAVPRLQQPRREAAKSPTRQPRERSPSRAIREANEYEKEVESGDIIDPDRSTKEPLSLRDNNVVLCTAV